MKLRAAAGPALLLAGFGALAVVLSPFHNTPVQDDWDYARTVQLLLRTGVFQRSEIAQATELFSALWGSAFVRLLGFSFDTLRLSTLALSAASLLVFYALLGELGFSGARRMAGVATLLACPLFVFLSFSFMTDVPALACLLAALYFYVRALQHSDLRLAFAGSVFASLAFLTRQLGLVSALAAASYFFVRPPILRESNKKSHRDPSASTAEGLGAKAQRKVFGSIVLEALSTADKASLAGETLIGLSEHAVAQPEGGRKPGRGYSGKTTGAGPRPYDVGNGIPILEPHRLGWVAASAALPAVVALVYGIWTAQNGGVTWANSRLTLSGTLEFVRDPQATAVLARRIVEDFMTLAIYLLPLWLLLLPGLRGLRACPRRPAVGTVAREAGGLPHAVVRPGRWLVVGTVLSAALFVFTAFRLAQRGEYLPYLTDVVTRQGLRPYLAYFAYAGGAFRADILPLPFWIALTVLGCVGGWALAVLALRGFAQANRWETGASGTSLVYWSAFCLAMPTLLFPEFYERFLLPFLPAAIILLLAAGRRARAAPQLAAAGVAVLALCSVVLMKDYWGWMDLRWPVAQSIVDAGVPLQKLDGGYEWDGWNLYEQSMELIRQKQLAMQITPWAYVIDPQYMITFAPLVGYHVTREVRFDSPFGAAAGRFYVLERD